MSNQPVPHLITANTGPLLALEQGLLDQQTAIEQWFNDQWRGLTPPFYCSVDLRNAGFKLAPVDTNLFPAGFNNLHADFMPLCIEAIKKTIEEMCPQAKGVLLIPESHTRNVFYLENVASLQKLLKQAGYKARIGSLLAEITAAKKINLPSGREILLEPLSREGNRVKVGDFSPCCIISNNDFSEIPTVLENIDQQISPPLKLGWSTRLKSAHFQHYQNVAHEFGQAFRIDPWFIAPLFRYCGEIDFMTREGEDCLIRNAAILLNAIKQKYRENQIDHEPFVVVKADAGTYGMGVMTVKDPEQIRQLNRKQRTRMSAAKGSRTVSKAIVQEGVYSFETWGEEQAVAEPVVYMIGKQVVGGFYRVHKARKADENLNAPGANFEPLAFAKSCRQPYRNSDSCTNRFYAYGVVARLALLAAARELAEITKEQ